MFKLRIHRCFNLAGACLVLGCWSGGIPDAYASECPQDEEVEFEWIGPDSSTTDDMGGRLAHRGIFDDAYGVPGTVFTIATQCARRAKEIRIVVFGDIDGPQPPPWTLFNFELHFWKQYQSYYEGAADPQSSLTQHSLGQPMNVSTTVPGCQGQPEYLCPWSYTWVEEIQEFIPTYEFRWDLTNPSRFPAIVLEPGEWVVSVISVNTEGTNSNMWLSHSNALGGPSGVYGSTVDQPPFWIHTNPSDASANWPMGFSTVSACLSGTCDSGEDSCNCPADCGGPPSNETECGDQLDDDCDGLTDCVDTDCSASTSCPNGQIPAISDWGLTVLGLLVLIGGTLIAGQVYAKRGA